MKADAFRLNAFVPNEQQLLAQIVEFLRWAQARGKIAWFARCNGGGMRDRTGQFFHFYRLYLPGSSPASKGMADLHGMLAGGRYFALEVKKPGEKVTEEQRTFLACVNAAGGVAGMVRNYAEAIDLLNKNQNEVER